MKIFFVALTLFGLEVSATGGGPANLPACEASVAACKAAGFVVGAHKKGDKEGEDKGLWVDCIAAAADKKKTIAGVDPTAAEACRKAAKEMKKGR